MEISPTTGHETSSEASNPSNATALALIYDEYGQQHQTEAQTISNTIKIDFFRLFLFSAAFTHSKRTTTRAEGYTTAVSDPIASIAAVGGATLLVTKQTELVYVYFSFFRFFYKKHIGDVMIGIVAGSRVARDAKYAFFIVLILFVLVL